MKINYSVKQLGKKHPIIKTQAIEIEAIAESPTLSELISAIVRQQVAAYEQRKEDAALIKYLSPANIAEQSTTGKVGFGTIYNENRVEVDQAIAAALLAFEDGLYCVFLDDHQIEQLTETLTITPDSTFTFLRLTFLAGSYW